MQTARGAPAQILRRSIPSKRIRSGRPEALCCNRPVRCPHGRRGPRSCEGAPWGCRDGRRPCCGHCGKASSMTFEEVVDLFLKERMSPRSASRGRQPGTHRYLRHSPCRCSQTARPTRARAEMAQLHDQLKDKPYQANRLVAVIGSLGVAFPCIPIFKRALHQHAQYTRTFMRVGVGQCATPIASGPPIAKVPAEFAGC